ncbi:MAG: fructose-6-phosphate aldolase [Pseudomonadota bacterium]|nr:fructose-6-phosphate aldolase [Pseudomonadota bacterium]
MLFFIDTADINEIRSLADTGLVDGVTTNPTLFAKAGGDFKKLIGQICEIVSGPVSAEVASTEFTTMLAEGRELARIAPNIAVKVPMTPDGLKACKTLSEEGIMINVTLCFSAAQAILAAKSGAAFISPFIGRLDDIGQDGMQLVRDIVTIYRQYQYFGTKVLAASIRGPLHVVDAAKAGADIATIPPAAIRKLFVHPLTKAGVDTFVKDWARTGQSIM